MATSVIPDLIDALIAAAATALPGVDVLDGPQVTDAAPGDYLMVGVEDLDSAEEANAAESRQQWANANYTARDEDGEITCVALSWNGDGDQKAARDAVFATAAALEDALRANPSLGVSSVLWTGYGSLTQFIQAQGDTGAAAQLTFRVHFIARL